ncbi:hypothetical protein Tco_0362539, partial [Tanacetum coccineum]
PIRRIQDFDESKDHCPTLKNTPYPSRRYGVSVPTLHEGFKSNTPYPGISIRRIQDLLLYTKLLEDIKCGPYSKKAQ